MRFPIDVIFLDAEDRVRRLHSRVGPWRIVLGGRGARQALELEAGAARASGLQVGDRILWDEPPATGDAASGAGSPTREGTELSEGAGASGGSWKYGLAAFLFVMAGVLLVIPTDPGAPPDEAATSGGEGGGRTQPECPSFAPELGVEAVPGAPPESETERALGLVKVADRLYEERELDRSHLHEALKLWREGATVLAAYEERPAILFEVLSRMQAAEDEACARYRSHRKSAEVAMASRRSREALFHAQVVLESVPDPSDLRYQWAKRVQLRARELLRAEAADDSPFGS
jgi:hypothetical protein